MGKQKRNRYIFGCCILLLVTILIIALASREKYPYEDILEENHWTIKYSESPVPTSGTEFCAKSTGAPFFNEYVQKLGVTILPDDKLTLYSYVLEETCIERPFHTFILEVNGEYCCGAIWYAEVLNGYGSTWYTADSYYPLDTWIYDLRVAAILEIFEPLINKD